jgi:CheY-like chemotaxis protein
MSFDIVMLPRLSGTDVLRELRRNSTLPVLMLTVHEEAVVDIANRGPGCPSLKSDGFSSPFIGLQKHASATAAAKLSAWRSQHASQKPTAEG